MGNGHMEYGFGVPERVLALLSQGGLYSFTALPHHDKRGICRGIYSHDKRGVYRP